MDSEMHGSDRFCAALLPHIQFERDKSILNFEGQTAKEAHNILNVLTAFLLQQCQPHVSAIDCQPYGLAGGFLVFITSIVQLANEEHALNFSEMFNLMPGWGKYFIVNDIFRLNYSRRQVWSW
ncbi:hypothetical protein UlMin_044099 [Ulmus minor]